MLYNVYLNHTCDLILDPITSIAPKFSSTTNIQGFKTQHYSSFDMLCPAQGYPVPISRWVGYYKDFIKKENPSFFFFLNKNKLLEPVSSTAPKFPLMAESFKSRSLQNVDMLCPAQGYPVPTHRYMVLTI